MIMFKKICTIFCLLVSLSIQAQNVDVRVGQLVNESNWFGLEQTLKTTPADSISPFLRQLATAMTHHYFNRPDSACTVLADLLNNHQQELGDRTMSMVILLSTNLARIGHYNDAADLLQNLYDQLTAMGTDSTLTEPYKAQAQQYRALGTCGPFYRPLHQPGEYRIPMVLANKGGQHSIEMDGSINGKEGRFLFDTGAGRNLITPKLAKEYGLRSLDTDITVAGVGGLKEGGSAIADTLRIGGMTWLNVPFAVIDTHTGHEEADKFNEKYQLPPVIGLPVMFCMQEIQLDFAHRELIIPATPTPNPLGKSNLIGTDNELLYYDMEELTKENDVVKFLEFADTPVMYGTDVYKKFADYEIERDTILIIDGSTSGKFKVFYKRAHDPFTTDSDDSVELPLPLKAHHLVPLLASYYIWLEDEKAKAVDYYNQYEKLSQKLTEGRTDNRIRILSGGI